MNLLHELSQLLESEAGARAKLQALKDEKKKLMRQFAASGFQSGVDPRYANHVKRLDASIKAAEHELQVAINRPGVEQEIRAAEKARAEAPIKHDPGAAISAGAKNWADLAKKYGDENKLNIAIKAAATKQTQNGLHPLDMQSLAREFGVPVNSMYRRIDKMRGAHQGAGDLSVLKRWFPKD